MSRNPLDANPNNASPAVHAARIYSNIFSPPSTFALFGFIIAWSKMPFWIGSFHAAIFGFLSSLVPILYIVYLLKSGQIEDLHISKQSDRHIPYVIGIAGAIAAFFILRAMGSSPLLLAFILTNIVAITLLAVINSRWLISAHTTSITTITLFAGFAFGPPVSLAIAPLILSTFYVRHFLKRHTMAEMLSGTLLGVTIVLGLAAMGAFNM
ncbi:MAG: hypothetical protein FJ010_09750 [Chloroflexi bacterium]|nr:hypothetical protein [Chloroflexota bacterium]